MEILSCYKKRPLFLSNPYQYPANAWDAGNLLFQAGQALLFLHISQDFQGSNFCSLLLSISNEYANRQKYVCAFLTRQSIFQNSLYLQRFSSFFKERGIKKNCYSSFTSNKRAAPKYLIVNSFHLS